MGGALVGVATQSQGLSEICWSRLAFVGRAVEEQAVVLHGDPLPLLIGGFPVHTAVFLLRDALGLGALLVFALELNRQLRDQAVGSRGSSLLRRPDYWPHC